MPTRPLGNNLLIRRAAAKDRTDSGLYIPDRAQKKPHRGTVVAAGAGYHSDAGALIPTECAVDDVVIYADGIGVDLEVDGEQLVLISEDSVLAIVSGE